ncbi:MAG: hypothetical protein HRF43_10265 [Phycisphaerae bacterium]|jgi:type II secretory pathway pseudopilin PulG
MTLVETLIAAILLGLVLLVLAEGTDFVRDQLRTRRTWDRLARLNRAMAAYKAVTGQWPAGAAGPHSRPMDETRPRPDETTRGSSPDHPRARATGKDDDFQVARRIVGELLAVADSRRVLEAGTDAAIDDEPLRAIQDGWGRPMRCLTARSPSPVDRQAVAANGGRPIIISDGPDGSAIPDPLRSDELPP